MTEEPLKYEENHGCGFGSYVKLGVATNGIRGTNAALNPLTSREIQGANTCVRGARTSTELGWARASLACGRRL